MPRTLPFSQGTVTGELVMLDGLGRTDQRHVQRKAYGIFDQAVRLFKKPGPAMASHSASVGPVDRPSARADSRINIILSLRWVSVRTGR